jgi:DNA-binding NarL/FixJ family response regulator
MEVGVMELPSEEVRARTFRLDGQEYLVMSFRVAPGPLPARLTAAEREVAESVARGASNAQIARERGRSVNTIAKQIASVFRKLRVHSRLELARALSSAGSVAR